MRLRTNAGALLAIALISACGQRPGGTSLDVQTFELKHLHPEAAARIIDPYVFGDRPGAAGMVSTDDQTRTLTVRETPEMLSRIAQVLEQYDQPHPDVLLHFQIIEANGAAAADPAIAEVEAALRQLFRFEGYTLVADALVRGQRWSNFTQKFVTPDDRYRIDGAIREIHASVDSGTVSLGIGLVTEDGVAFETSVNARLGQTLILGTAQPNPRRGAMILTLKAELDTL